MRPRLRSRPAAFTLVELLVVIGIIAILVGILLPVLSNARRSAYDLQCSSNIKQIVTALLMYANENKGKFPPNIYDPAYNPIDATKVNWWYDADRIGKYLPKTVKYGTGSIGGPILHLLAR